MGNTFVLFNYILVFGGTEKTSVHIILIHLAFTNIIMLLSKGMPKTIAAFGLGNFLSDIACKFTVYLERVARGLSICTSSLLTVVQAIAISPTNSVWRKLKLKNQWHVLPIFGILWILNSFISMNLPFFITSINSVNISQVTKSDKYCYFLPESWIIKWTFLTLMVLRDVVFQSLMGWSSGYMAFHLYKHHKCVLYLHKSRFSSSSSPEIRATQSTLVLMICFLFFYWVDFILSFYTGSTVTHDSTILYIKVFFGLGYAVLCPFVLVSWKDRGDEEAETQGIQVGLVQHCLLPDVRKTLVRINDQRQFQRQRGF
ncbi:vomeronasal type-1 receptor 3-like [Ctenodactylus gundi]